MQQNHRALPTLSELHHDPQQAFKNDQLNLLLNQPPHASWLKQHPMAKTKNDQGQQVASLYLPIDKIEYLLSVIFQEWRVEIKSVTVAFQSMVVVVRLHLRNPLTGEWFYQDGVGASPVQTDSGKSAADLGAIKSAGVQMAAPAAETYAIKDAAEKLGTLFGKDLNRRDIIMFAGAYSEPAPTAPSQPAAPQAPQQPQPGTHQYAPLPMNQFKDYRDKLFPDTPAAQPQQMPQQRPATNGHTPYPQQFNPSML